MWRWFSGLLKDKRKPSEYIRLHLSGRGNGYGLDDLMSWHDSDPEWEDVIEEILAISRDFSSQQHPIGISNRASDAALEALAERLEAEGR